MKVLFIVETTLVGSGSEIIGLYDSENKRASYIYTTEVNYQDWVIEQANSFRKNGYKIFNNTEIKLT